MHRWTLPGVKAPRPAKGAPQDVGEGKAPAAPKEQVRLPEFSDLKPECDPYLTWAVLSDWRGYPGVARSPARDKKEADVPILLCVNSHDELARLVTSELVVIPPVYLEAIPGSSRPRSTAIGRYATGRIKRSKLAQLIKDFPKIAFELGAPLRDQGSPLLGDAQGYYGQQTDLAASVTKRVFKTVRDPNVPKAADMAGTIAVFDYGCPFLRSEYTGADGATRIAALWHQERMPECRAPWAAPGALGYGRELQGETLGDLCEQAWAPGAGFDEARAYSSLNYLIDYDDPRRRVHLATHGAHVLDVAGGRPNPARRNEPDAADEAKLVFVQMPEATAGDSSGASLGVYLLDALRYVLHVTDPAAPLVVSVSYGSTAGAHDGKSLIEQAMDELLQHRPQNFAIVLAAGNARRLGLHAARTSTAESTALFRIDVAAGDHTDTFVEFWYDKPADATLDFRVRLPAGDWSDWVKPDNSVELRGDATQEVIATLISRLTVPNGERAMALLAMRPTEAPDDDDGDLAEPGLWEVEARLQAKKGGSVTIDAWVRRDGSRPFSGRVQSSFVGLQPSDTENTLSDLASGDLTVVVGGFRWSDGMAAGYSSVGPRRKEQYPMVYGMCEWDSIDAGIRAAAVRSGETLLMNGTSVAAPVVARQIYNAMAAAAAEKPPRTLDRAAVLDKLRDEARLRGSLIRVDAAPPAAGVI